MKKVEKIIILNQECFVIGTESENPINLGYKGLSQFMKCNGILFISSDEMKTDSMFE